MICGEIINLIVSKCSKLTQNKVPEWAWQGGKDNLLGIKQEIDSRTYYQMLYAQT